MSLIPIAGKLAKLIRLLGTDKEGEKLATVNALVRTLQANNCDLHMLADAIEAGPAYLSEELIKADRARRLVEEELKKAQEIRRQKERHAQPSWHEIACECRDRGTDHLNEWEESFVSDMCRRTVWGGSLTEKQQGCLRKIYMKIGRAA